MVLVTAPTPLNKQKFCEMSKRKIRLTPGEVVESCGKLRIKPHTCTIILPTKFPNSFELSGTCSCFMDLRTTEWYWPIHQNKSPIGTDYEYTYHIYKMSKLFILASGLLHQWLWRCFSYPFFDVLRAKGSYYVKNTGQVNWSRPPYLHYIKRPLAAMNKRRNVIDETPVLRALRFPGPGARGRQLGQVLQ